MAQHEYLGVLGEGLRPGDSDEPEQPTEQPIEQRQGHSSAWSSTSELVKPRIGVIGPYNLAPLREPGTIWGCRQHAKAIGPPSARCWDPS